MGGVPVSDPDPLAEGTSPQRCVRGGDPDAVRPLDERDEESAMSTTIFRSSSATEGAPGYRERSGEPVTVVREVTAEVDPAIEEEDVAPLYVVRFEDGVETEAFADELEPAPVAEAS
jgi:hypothetical protein